MTPIKLTDLLDDLALQEGMDPAYLKDIVTFFYEELSKEMIQLNHINIQMHGLGTFQSRPTIMKREYSRLQTLHATMNIDTIKRYMSKADVAADMELIERNLAIWESDFARRREVRRRYAELIKNQNA